MKFSYNPRIIRQLGTELITSDAIAIMELIKNSYDAKANKINLLFFSSPSSIKHKQLLNPMPTKIQEIINEYGSQKLIVIEDNGYGMNKKTIEDGFFQIGSELKNKERQNINDIDDASIILGDKGIGRLSAQRISPVLILETTSYEDNNINIIVIDWYNFYNNIKYEAPEYEVQKKEKISYTRLWCISDSISDDPDRLVNFSNYIEKIEYYKKDAFNKPVGKRKDIFMLKETILSALNFLYLPFSDIETNIELKAYYNDIELDTKFNIDKIRISELVHSFDISNENNNIIVKLNLDIKPWFIERIHMNETGKKLYKDWIHNHTYYSELLNKYQNRFRKTLNIQRRIEEIISGDDDDIEDTKESLTKILPVCGKVFSFKRTSQFLKLAIDSAKENKFIPKETKIDTIKEFLNAYNGIKLYRNGYRIASLGDKNSDWLKLQQERTKGQQFFRFELGNVIGYVQVNDPYQKYISETSSRNQIVSNKIQDALERTLHYIFNTAFYKFTKYAVDITKDILYEEQLIPKRTSKEIKSKLDISKKILNQTIRNIKIMSNQFEEIEQNISLDNEDKISKVQKSFKKLKETVYETNEYLDRSVDFLKDQNEILAITEKEKKEIETEAYNNFKLMANGLITEVITHELHSLISDTDKDIKNQDYFDHLKEYIRKNKDYEIISKFFNPIKSNFDRIYNKITDVNKFYKFLEKTFIYKGTLDDFENVLVKDFVEEFQQKFNSRLVRNKIDLINHSSNLIVEVPKGSLIHLFYNLFDNSIYWIRERQRKAEYDNSFKIDGNDYICIEKKNENIIHFYDSGTGVLPEYQNTLFHALESGKRNGRGMGLYIVKRFLESFDAVIQLRPEINNFGNRYIFEIILNKKIED